MANQGPIDPTQIRFHLTGFKQGSVKGAFGASLAAEIFAEIKKIMQKFEGSMQGGVDVVKKLKAVMQKIGDLSDLLQSLGTQPMNPAQISAWLKKFSQKSAEAKAAIEALGNKQWISMLEASLAQVDNLVKSTNFLQMVQDAARQLVNLYEAMNSIWTEHVTPVPVQFFNTIKSLQADATGLGNLGSSLSKVGNATHDSQLAAIGQAMINLGKDIQAILNRIFGAKPTVLKESTLGEMYTKWLQDVEKGDTAGAKKILQQMQGWWNRANHASRGVAAQWKYFADATNKVYETAVNAEKMKVPADLTIRLINDIETGTVAGISWTAFPELDGIYKRAIAAIEAMDQIGSQFSKQSITTLNSLMTGMTAVIRNFDKAMMQSQRSVDLSITDINKRS